MLRFSFFLFDFCLFKTKSTWILFCTPCLTLFFFALHPGCRLWGRRSRGTRRDHGGERRTLSFTNWPRCYRCRAPSPVSWTRPPSSGSPSATWRWGTSPTKGTRHGTCAWRDHLPTPLSKVGWTWAQLECFNWCMRLCVGTGRSSLGLSRRKTSERCFKEPGSNDSLMVQSICKFFYPWTRKIQIQNIKGKDINLNELK